MPRGRREAGWSRVPAPGGDVLQTCDGGVLASISYNPQGLQDPDLQTAGTQDAFSIGCSQGGGSGPWRAGEGVRGRAVDPRP